MTGYADPKTSWKNPAMATRNFIPHRVGQPVGDAGEKVNPEVFLSNYGGKKRDLVSIHKWPFCAFPDWKLSRAPNFIYGRALP